MPKRTDGNAIPQAELDVLGALWRRGPSTVREVMDALASHGRRLAYTTVLTLLGRLEKRGCVHQERDPRAHVYSPRVRREEVAADRVGSLVGSGCGEAAVPLLLKLVEAQNLSADDIQALREHLEKLEETARGAAKRGRP